MIDQTGQRVLVTGGAGYIGSHCTKRLEEKGYQVVVYDDLSEGHREMVLGQDFVQGDLGDYDRLTETFEGLDIDAVMHFAAFCRVGESMEEPQKYYHNNVENGLKLLAAMREAAVKKIIFSSSAAVYGAPREVPISEEHPKDPTNPYGRTKLFFERILADYAPAYGLRCRSLRYFNAAGADPEGEIGERHRPESHLIPLVLEVALGEREEIEIFGTDYETRDGTCVRDFIHVNDLAEAHILALEALENGEEGHHRAYNLGIGQGYSVREVIESCRRVTGREIKAVEGERRAGDPPELIADPGRANKELNWQPQFRELDDIVRTAWEWHKKEAGL